MRLASLTFFLVGCGDAEGIVRIHFALRPADALELEADAGPPPLDPFEAGGASGAVEVLVAQPHFMVEIDRLPAMESAGLVWHLWISDEVPDHAAHAIGDSVEGEWALVDDLEPDASGHAEAHKGASLVPLPLETIRQAIVTVDAQAAEVPSTLIALAGGTGLDPEEEGVAAAPPGGHSH